MVIIDNHSLNINNAIIHKAIIYTWNLDLQVRLNHRINHFPTFIHNKRNSANSKT